MANIDKIKVDQNTARALNTFISYKDGFDNRMSKFVRERDMWTNDYLPLKGLSYEQMAIALLVGWEPYPEIAEGDIVISKQDPFGCDIRIVEASDKNCILLVNGKQDKSYDLPHDLAKFWDEWMILCKKEDRKDIKEMF